jgi:subtilisin family serine protease
MKSQKSRTRCSLPPFKITPVLAQDLSQKTSWSITVFDIPEAWKESQGEGVKVAVLDTGCDIYHEDLVANLLPGMNIINPKRPPLDGCRHGTHCCGTICASNNDIGVVGVAPKSNVIPVKILDDEGGGDMIHVAKGIIWAADNGADIISLSLGCPYPIQQVRKAIQAVSSRGVPVFVAAGNANLKQLLYPAGYPETISISAIDKDFKKARFSNVAKNLDFFAPGKDILSTIPNNQYGILSGTSMACPWAAGIAALLLSYTRNHKTKIQLKTVSDYKDAFRKYSSPVKDKGLAECGVIDPRKFIEWVKQGD